MLYNEKILKDNKVPIAAAIHINDMYVNRKYSMELVRIIPNMIVWETKNLEHNTLRSNGGLVLDFIFSLIK